MPGPTKDSTEDTQSQEPSYLLEKKTQNSVNITKMTSTIVKVGENKSVSNKELANSTEPVKSVQEQADSNHVDKLYSTYTYDRRIRKEETLVDCHSTENASGNSTENVAKHLEVEVDTEASTCLDEYPVTASAKDNGTGTDRKHQKKTPE